MGGMNEFLYTLGSNLPHTKNRDHMRWKLTKNGDFDIRSFYNKLRSPLRVSFFVWTAHMFSSQFDKFTLNYKDLVVTL